MCNNCIHKAVCSKFAATGGHVKSCEHHREDAVTLEEYNALKERYERWKEIADILDTALRQYQRQYGE